MTIVNSNSIGDEGAEQLLEAFGNKNCTLTEFDVEGNNLDEEQLVLPRNASTQVMHNILA